MSDQMGGRERAPDDSRDSSDRKGFGDDQGTRVGSPSEGRPDEPGHLGSGSESSEGIHAADGDRDQTDKTSLEGKSTGRGEENGVQRSGSEPQTSHDREHRSNYGGGSRPE